MKRATEIGDMKTKTVCKVLLSATLLLTAAATRTEAIVIVGTSTEAIAGTGIGRAGPLNHAYAAGFTMPGQDYTLTDVQLTLVNYGGPQASVIGIYLDNAGVPGSLHALLNDPPAGGSPQEYTFTPSGLVTLSANTAYWLVVAAESGATMFDQFAWKGALDSPTGVAIFDGYRESSDGGSSFPRVGLANVLFTINGELLSTSVPDAASTLTLLGLAFVSLMGFRSLRATE